MQASGSRLQSVQLAELGLNGAGGCFPTCNGRIPSTLSIFHLPVSSRPGDIVDIPTGAHRKGQEALLTDMHVGNYASKWGTQQTAGNHFAL